jgi:putative Ca2+/H+ antiporter (TMEM165/GDT1 family)
MSHTDPGPSRTATTALTAIGVVIGVVVAVLASDVILGIIVGSAFIAIAVGMLRLWAGGGTPRSHHP